MQTTVEAPPAPRATDASSPAAAYEALMQQSKVLHDQLDALLEQRSDIVREINVLSGETVVGAARTGLEDRAARIDKRIAGLEEQIVQADAQVARAAAVPGSVVPPPYNSSDEDLAGAFFGGATTMTIIMVVWTMIRRRRARKRGKPVDTGFQALPNEIASRMERLESVAESTALEVERIGEGQRFVTKLLSEQRQGLPLSRRD